MSCLKGRHSYGCPTVHDYCGSSFVGVGNFSSIAVNVSCMLGGGHRLDWATTFPFHAFRESWTHPVLDDHARDRNYKPSRGPIWVGSSVWIGEEAKPMSGVRIGHGATIGANVVVTKDVPPYAVVVGNPARVVRYLFPEDTISRLLQVAWWNWSDRKINALLPELVKSPDMAVMEAASDAYDVQEAKASGTGVFYVGYGVINLGLADVTDKVRAALTSLSEDKRKPCILAASDIDRFLFFGCADPFPNVQKHVQVRSKHGSFIYEVGCRVYIWSDGRHSVEPAEAEQPVACEPGSSLVGDSDSKSSGSESGRDKDGDAPRDTESDTEGDTASDTPSGSDDGSPSGSESDSSLDNASNATTETAERVLHEPSA